jgi:hypothetical protein
MRKLLRTPPDEGSLTGQPSVAEQKGLTRTVLEEDVSEAQVPGEQGIAVGDESKEAREVILYSGMIDLVLYGDSIPR